MIDCEKSKNHGFYDEAVGCKWCAPAGASRILAVDAPKPWGDGIIVIKGGKPGSETVFSINGITAKIKHFGEYKMPKGMKNMDQNVILELLKMDAFQDMEAARNLYHDWVEWETKSKPWG